MPLWVNEGLSDYERGAWTPLDLMMVRDAAVADVVPNMSQLQGYGNGNSPRLIYNLGHALFEFIEAKWGKEGIRSFIFALRKSVIGGGEDAYEEAFRMKPAEFDQAFDRYLKDRFRPFRDKERPADYGMNLAPDAEKTEFMQAFTIAPSPSGDLMAVVTVNRKDREYDIVLLSAKDGSKFKNLTEGFDKDMGFSYLAIPGERYTTVHWLSWSPKGDRIAYFARTEKERALIVQNVTNRKVEVKIPMRFVDEPESPSFSPDGSTIAFSALTSGISDIFTVDLATGKYENLTSDDFADFAPGVLARRQVPDLHGAHQWQPQALQARSRHQAEDADHVRHARRGRRRSSSMRTPSCSRPRPLIRRCHSSPTSRATATSSTSGRST